MYPRIVHHENCSRTLTDWAPSHGAAGRVDQHAATLFPVGREPRLTPSRPCDPLDPTRSARRVDHGDAVAILGDNGPMNGLSIWHWLAVIAYLALIYVFFKSLIRILNRMGFSGWYSLLSLIPIVNIFALRALSKAKWRG